MLEHWHGAVRSLDNLHLLNPNIDLLKASIQFSKRVWAIGKESNDLAVA